MPQNAKRGDFIVSVLQSDRQKEITYFSNKMFFFYSVDSSLMVNHTLVVCFVVVVDTNESSKSDLPF